MTTDLNLSSGWSSSSSMAWAKQATRVSHLTFHNFRLIKLRVKVDNPSILILFSDDVIFTLSMVTSYCAIVYYGLKFNERNTNPFAKWLICLPMFMASVAGNIRNALKSKKMCPKVIIVFNNWKEFSTKDQKSFYCVRNSRQPSKIVTRRNRRKIPGKNHG